MTLKCWVEASMYLEGRKDFENTAFYNAEINSSQPSDKTKSEFKSKLS